MDAKNAVACDVKKRRLVDKVCTRLGMASYDVKLLEHRTVVPGLYSFGNESVDHLRRRTDQTAETAISDEATRHDLVIVTPIYHDWAEAQRVGGEEKASYAVGIERIHAPTP